MALLPDSPWAVILPVKSLRLAKSRIDPAAGGIGGTLALAFFQDTLAAVLATPRVAHILVATHDDVIGSLARESGCLVVDDSAHPGINAAAAWAADQRPAAGPVAVLVSDLPCLTPAAMTAVLDAGRAALTSFVADAEGTGTTMWLTTGGAGVDSRFGADSAAAHRLAGATDLAAGALEPAAFESARRDVDTEADLADAIRIGVGPRTQDALDGMVRGAPVVVTALRRVEGGALEVADEQGRRHRVTWSSVSAAGLREVRPGQRLTLDPASSTILGLP